MHLQQCYYFMMAFIAYRTSSEEVKISDACHGLGTVPRTFNDLECDSGFLVNITEVRFYQKSDADQTCPTELSNAAVPQSCCVHNTSRCSWIRRGNTDVQTLQTQCQGLSACKLHSQKPVGRGRLCDELVSRFSSVRSIKYVCIPRKDTESATAEVTDTTTIEEVTTERREGTLSTPKQNSTNATSPTVQDHQTESSIFMGATSVDQTTVVEQFTPPSVFTMSTDRISSTPEDDKYYFGVIIGAFLGGIAVCVTLIVLVVCVRRRAKSRAKPAPVNDAPTRTSATNPGYFDVVYSEASVSPNIYSEEKSDFDQYEMDDGSELYSKINDQEGEYAELADFREPTDKPKPEEYDHIIGELPGAFPARHASDYDHVAVDNDDQENHSGAENENNTGHYFEVKKTYDTLQRNDSHNEQGYMNKEASEPYNVLGRPTVDTAGKTNSMR